MEIVKTKAQMLKIKLPLIKTNKDEEAKPSNASAQNLVHCKSQNLTSSLNRYSDLRASSDNQVVGSLQLKQKKGSGVKQQDLSTDKIILNNAKRTKDNKNMYALNSKHNQIKAEMRPAVKSQRCSSNQSSS